MGSDIVFIDRLRLRGVIGVLPHERVEAQPIDVSLRLACDARRAGLSDNLDDAVNYAGVIEAVTTLVETASFYLVEKLAEEIAACCLGYSAEIQAVTVRVAKPTIIPNAAAVGVEITRSRA